MMDDVVALAPTPGLTAGACHPIYKKPELLAQDAMLERATSLLPRTARQRLRTRLEIAD
jgi:hypothetical protein